MTIYLSEHQTFSDVQELNHHVKLHTDRHRYEMNDTQRTVLQFIARYSAKYAGASHLKTETIAAGVDKSRRTVERAIGALVRLNIIEKVSTTRRIKGGKGANIYRVMPFNDVSEVSHCEEPDKPTETSDRAVSAPKETTNLLISNACITYTSATPYGRFKSFIEQFIGKDEKALVHRLYGVYLGQSKALRKVYEARTLIDVACRGIAVTFQATKSKRIRNVAGYFNGVICRLFDEMYEELLQV
ncbi:helix-turn-helix domain-containing protein [Terribacillus saccharophilus]|uniref:Helix-turn-helix domain-containing protein n=1 Tax=Terribacillus saccharophilus TaxID=361277 RepID=A0ABX4H0B3_9BACI|nr:helix-turn-helix domain-containing protein [Terribacillus saccharophilus]PAD35954.1 hypothetical protein CHH56_05885 [Terribacillus saccharophilus]PAD96996.1 hypothetical protein CHH50_06425 [Terribacillus saccharophilus]PAE00572.1 hypothetical protein CHH48_07330 [Terribacillus saccharophilus]